MMIRTKNHPFHEHHGSLSITIAILCLIPMDMAPFASVAITSWVALSILVILVNSVVVVCEPLWSSVCQGDHAAAQFPFCDGSLSIKERVNDYVQRIPIPGQIAMMGNAADGYEPLGIPPYQWWSEGLHGALEPCVPYSKETKCPTSFPCPSALGNTFNSTLYWKIGEAIGKEGRAISGLRDHDMNVGDGLTYWSPNVNLQRDPRWGRNQEGESHATMH
jgi:beta-glucosidase-like glycosyl hydrolase